MKREDIFKYVKRQYGTIPEYLWEKSPDNAVLRHKNRKWYAVLMSIKKSKLGLEEDGMADIMNVKCEPIRFFEKDPITISPRQCFKMQGSYYKFVNYDEI